MFLFKKNKDLLELYMRYLGLCLETLETFREALEYSFSSGIDGHFEAIAGKVHEKESDADDVRRQIERMMYEQSLLPESREDILDIIERIDMVPNCADHLATLMTIQRIPFHPDLRNDVGEQMKLSIEAFKSVKDAAIDCLMKMERIKELQTLIDYNESLGDKVEHNMIRKIFSADMGVGDKIIQKDMINQLGEICNLCEHVMDRIVICSIKRRL